eukprot:jgi/Orpsp1_1/1177431/evm.model.c7180000061429.1
MTDLKSINFNRIPILGQPKVDFDDWKFSYERWCASNKVVGDEEKLECLISLTEGIAKKIVINSLDKSTPDDFDTIINKLQKHYKGLFPKNSRLLELSTITIKKGENVSEFNIKFDTLLNKIKIELSKEVIISYYINAFRNLSKTYEALLEAEPKKNTTENKNENKNENNNENNTSNSLTQNKSPSQAKQGRKRSMTDIQMLEPGNKFSIIKEANNLFPKISLAQLLSISPTLRKELRQGYKPKVDNVLCSLYNIPIPILIGKAKETFLKILYDTGANVNVITTGCLSRLNDVEIKEDIIEQNITLVNGSTVPTKYLFR